jgi:hypothetical protein
MIACYGLPVETRGRSSCSVGSRSFGRGILVRQLEDRRSSAQRPRDQRRQGPELKLGRHELVREPACPPARRDRACMRCGSVVGQRHGETSETRTLKRQKMCRPLLFSQLSANPRSWGSRGRRFESCQPDRNPRAPPIWITPGRGRSLRLVSDHSGIISGDHFAACMTNCMTTVRIASCCVRQRHAGTRPGLTGLRPPCSGFLFSRQGGPCRAARPHALCPSRARAGRAAGAGPRATAGTRQAGYTGGRTWQRCALERDRTRCSEGFGWGQRAGRSFATSI